MSGPLNGSRRARGASLIYVTVGLVAFAGFASLGIDVAHVRLVKRQLQCAADAAARAGAVGLATSTTTAQQNATSAAALNTADGQSVVLQTSDIEFGTWNSSTQTFTVLTGAAQSGANAVRITTRHTSATSNPVNLTFGPVVGRNSCDVTATSIASTAGGYGLIGLASVTLSGNSTIGFWSATGTTAPHGSIASDGNITLKGTSYIQGDARPGPFGTVSIGGSATVTGSTAPLSKLLTYPPGSAGGYATSNNDSNFPAANWNSGTNDLNISSGSVSVPGGNYYFHDFDIGSSGILTVTGPATVYLTGNLSLNGTAVTASNLAKNFNIVMVGSGSVNVGSQSNLYASIYAPLSNVTLSGSGNIYGSVLGWTVNMTGTSAIYYDLSLPGGWGVSLAQ